MEKLLLIILITLSGCNDSQIKGNLDKDYIYKETNSPLRDEGVDNSVFDKYSDRFAKEFDVVVDVPILFEDNDHGAAAVCYRWVGGYSEINVVHKFWVDSSEAQKEQLIFHELAHCVLQQGHRDDHERVGPNICPVSIMRSWAFGDHEIENCYKEKRKQYIQEVIDNNKTEEE